LPTAFQGSTVTVQGNHFLVADGNAPPALSGPPTANWPSVSKDPPANVGSPMNTSLAITVGTSIPFGQQPFRVVNAGNQASAPYQVFVTGRRTGSFSQCQVSKSISSAGQPLASPDGAYTVQLNTGGPSGTLTAQISKLGGGTVGQALTLKASSASVQWVNDTCSDTVIATSANYTGSGVSAANTQIVYVEGLAADQTWFHNPNEAAGAGLGELCSPDNSIVVIHYTDPQQSGMTDTYVQDVQQGQLLASPSFSSTPTSGSVSVPTNTVPGGGTTFSLTVGNTFSQSIPP
jgi:hypothetical protein